MKNFRLFIALLVFIVSMLFVASIRNAKFIGKRLYVQSKLQSMSIKSSSTTIKYKPLIASHPSYEKVDTFTINEYGLEGALYHHIKSGAQVISISAADENKVFGITFR